MLRTICKSTIAMMAFVLVAIQFAPRGASNPPVHPERRFENHVQITPEVAGIVRKACMDCHSNETRWPWYSRIAPVSWLIAHDVERGRKAMNLSEWSAGPGRKPVVAASMLATMCVDARSGRMPRFPYAYMHPEARLSRTELDSFCGWTREEFARLAIEHKRLQKAARTPQLRAEVRGKKARGPRG